MTTRARVADQAGPRTKTTATTPAKKTPAKKTTRKAAVKKAFQQPSTRDFVKKMTVEIDQDAHAELKMIAARDGVTIRDIISGLIDGYIKKHR
ncbi:hypothetical protein CFAEC_13760 (plasmid) [Corynebacterium faecale]|uniref:plasmid partition protein ParG n=1 Tax=Corynebacterium faecale TaxID=1758466 RepID=UPI0025B4A6FE|nr:plasmid partition protein ParG [Corynebacterium faecale]WJY93537.1 hypothetical protein CFAEC_13760 [Corynebacterium faecale]